MKKKIAVLFLATMMALGAFAQKLTTMPTLYKEFRPAVITFTDGHKSRNALTNVFLKNASLLFLKGELTMEANMDNILSVDFDDRHFVNIDNQLACIVDSVGDNVLYRVDLFDKESYERNLRNNVNYSQVDFGNVTNGTSLEMSDFINTATIDINNEDDYKLPVIPVHYMLYNGKMLKVHERTLRNRLPKDKRRMYETIINREGFSWVKDDQLMELLRVISDR